MTYKRKQLILIGRNLLFGTIGMFVSNPISIFVISLLILFFFSFKIMVIYIALVLLIRPFVKDKIISDELKLKISNDKLSQNIYAYVQYMIRIEVCISTVAFLWAEILNYSISLMLKKRDLNYIAMLMACYLIVIYYKTRIEYGFKEENSESFTKKLNAKVLSDISSNNNSMNQELKSKLSEKSYETISIMLNLDSEEDLKSYTADLIYNYLRDKTYTDERLNNIIFELIGNVNDSFKKSIIRHNDNLNDTLSKVYKAT